MSHTPGKWHMMDGGFSLKSKIDNPNMIQIYATNDDLEMICQVWRDGMLHDRVQDFKSNARLIVAAPEMFKLLKRISEGDYREVEESAKEIIKSVTDQ